MPFFSVILPTYNRAHMLAKAIESVLGQTFKDWELIIVDDGSTDNTEGLVKTYSDSRIHYYRQENRERSAARNAGISLAVGKYMCFLDSDDSYMPRHLSAFNEELEKLGFPSCFLFCDLYAEEHHPARNNPYLNRENLNPLERIFAAMICLPQACIEHSVLMRHKFNEYIHLGEDLELWSRIVVDYPLVYVNSKTVLVGEHAERSIYLAKDRYKQNMELARRIFRNAPQHMRVAQKIRCRFYANCYYGQAKECMANQEFTSALLLILKAIAWYPFRMVRHKVFLLFALIFWRTKAMQMIGKQEMGRPVNR